MQGFFLWNSPMKFNEVFQTLKSCLAFRNILLIGLLLTTHANAKGLETTIGFSGGFGGVISLSSGLAGLDLSTILRNLASSFINVEHLALGIFYVLGIGVFIAGIYDLVEFGMMHQSDPMEKLRALTKVSIGALLIYFPSSVQVFSQSLFGENVSLSYQTITSNIVYSSAKVILQLAGFIWFVRGLFMLMTGHEAGERLRHFKGVIYMASGILAANLDYAVSSTNYLVKTVMDFFKSL